jgi:hypothetical protein
MALGQSCNKLLHDLVVGERLSKGAHIYEVSWRKAPPFQGNRAEGLRRADR